MANPHGTPIWYELLTTDPAASKAFYDAVLDWTIADRADQPGPDYRMIACSDGGFVGGMMTLDNGMTAGGARPSWLFYVGVDDVDASAKEVTAAGGCVHVAPFDIPGAGRAAMIADPQGLPFYIMRGSSPEASDAFDPAAMGRCAWNELMTPDQPAAQEFYARLFGWTYPDRMTMPQGMGDYVFIDAAGTGIGANMAQPGPDQPAGWRFYFRAPDIDAAAAQVTAGGGTIHVGPMEVPGGERMIVAADPHGVAFGVVAPGQGEVK